MNMLVKRSTLMAAAVVSILAPYSASSLAEAPTLPLIDFNNLKFDRHAVDSENPKFPAKNAKDGNANTYWQTANGVGYNHFIIMRLQNGISLDASQPTPYVLDGFTHVPAKLKNYFGQTKDYSFEVGNVVEEKNGHKFIRWEPVEIKGGNGNEGRLNRSTAAESVAFLPIIGQYVRFNAVTNQAYDEDSNCNLSEEKCDTLTLAELGLHGEPYVGQYVNLKPAFKLFVSNGRTTKEADEETQAIMLNTTPPANVIFKVDARDPNPEDSLTIKLDKLVNGKWHTVATNPPNNTFEQPGLQAGYYSYRVTVQDPTHLPVMKEVLVRVKSASLPPPPVTVRPPVPVPPSCPPNRFCTTNLSR